MCAVIEITVGEKMKKTGKNYLKFPTTKKLKIHGKIRKKCL